MSQQNLSLKAFQEALELEGLAPNSVKAYTWTARFFRMKYGEINRDNLLAFKGYLMEHFKPGTVNLRLQGINRYLQFLHQDPLKMKFVKVQQRSCLENVLSDADYRLLKQRLKADGHLQWYFIVWFMGATGARVSELLRIQAEDVHAGCMDLYSKGGKIRRLYIPEQLQREALVWLSERSIRTGPLFLNRYGTPISTRGIALRLKHFARKYGIDPSVVHPHSFRHLFAKNFLERSSDIAFLADLMGHGSIETTRIYLRKTATEQRQLVDRTVTW